jgi:UDP-2,3-diacylglucosamine hydrolase
MNTSKPIPQLHITVQPGKSIYFASDFHLGSPNTQSSIQREKKICQWLQSIQPTCQHLFLLGDIFDFWYEYKNVVPKGHVRLLGLLATFADHGIPITLFTGNHDMWMFDYLKTEIGPNLSLYKHPIPIQINNTSLLIGHGDGLGPADYGYKNLKKLFASPILQWLFARLHPNLGIGLMKWFSRKSRNITALTPDTFLGPQNEWLIAYCLKKLSTTHYHYFVFGHRHLALQYPLSATSTYINTGDWLHFNSYAAFTNNTLELRTYTQ